MASWCGSGQSRTTAVSRAMGGMQGSLPAPATYAQGQIFWPLAPSVRATMTIRPTPGRYGCPGTPEPVRGLGAGRAGADDEGVVTGAQVATFVRVRGEK